MNSPGCCKNSRCHSSGCTCFCHQQHSTQGTDLPFYAPVTGEHKGLKFLGVQASDPCSGLPLMYPHMMLLLCREPHRKPRMHLCIWSVMLLSLRPEFWNQKEMVTGSQPHSLPPHTPRKLKESNSHQDSQRYIWKIQLLWTAAKCCPGSEKRRHMKPSK